jgi:hypothetical protein
LRRYAKAAHLEAQLRAVDAHTTAATATAAAAAAAASGDRNRERLAAATVWRCMSNR